MSIRILLVEDEGIVARDIRHRLEGLGYVVAAVVPTGEEAVRKALEIQPDLVLMDIVLKGATDGVEAASQIQARLDIPVIYLTAHSDSATLQRAKITKPFGYILKPFEERDLHTTIEIALYKYELEKKLRESEERYRQRSAELEVLYDVSLRLNAQLETHELLHLIVEQAVALLGAVSGGLHIYDSQRNELLFSVGVGHAAEFVGRTLKPGEGLAGRAFENRRTMVVGDYAGWPGRAPVYDGDERLKATLAVPLLGKEGVLGVLSIGGGEKRAFDEHDIWLAELFAAQAAVALENARLYVEVQRRARELAALNKAGQAIVSVLDRDEVLRLVIAEVRELLDAEGASVLLCEPASALDSQVNGVCEELVFAAAASPGSESLVGMRLPITSGIAGWVVRNKRSALVGEVSHDARFYSGVDAQTGLTTQDLVAAPLVVQEKVIGVVEAINKAGGDFSRSDLEALEMMAGSAAIAIENARLFRAEREQRDLAETLREVGATLAATLDIEVVLDNLLEQVGRVVPYDAANVMLVEDDQARVVRVRGYEKFGVEDTFLDRTYPLSSIPNLQRMVETGEVIVVRDTYADPAWIQRSETGWQRSYAGAPIRVRGEVVGLLNVVSTTPGFFDQQNAGRLRAFADQAAIAIENARLFQAEREQRQFVEKSQAQLVRSEKLAATGRLAAGVAHEINNPLQSVLGCLGLAEEALMEGEDAGEYLRVAHEEVLRIRRIVARMRDLHRPESGERKPTDVNALMGQVLELSRKQCQQSQVEVDWAPAAGLPQVVLTPDQIKQVFLNLLLNAIDAMPGGGRLQVGTAYTEAPPGVRIQFCDSGAGIPPEILPHIFEAFYSTKPEGTGLGLSISYSIVEGHGGHIDVDSRPGEGSTFTVWLPA